MYEPITAICIVDRKSNCPPHFSLIDKTAEGEDADLWKDGLFRSKVTRYICYTRSITASQWNHVITNIALIGNKDPVPQGYMALRETVDTKQEGLRKNILCVKLIPKTATDSAINEIKLMRTERYKAEMFTNVGEVNGINICYKLNRISPANPLAPARPAPQVPVEMVAPLRTPPPQIPKRPLKPSGSIHIQDPHAAISGVPFKLHDRLLRKNSMDTSEDNMNFTVKSKSELDAKFSYDFSRERGLISR